MKREQFAAALAEGVRAAYSMSFEQAIVQLEATELISGDVGSDCPVHWSINGRQMIDEESSGACVELRVSVTDGMFEDWVFVYVRERPLPLNWGIADIDEDQ